MGVLVAPSGGCDQILATAPLSILAALSQPMVQLSFDNWREQLRSNDPLNTLKALLIACNLRTQYIQPSSSPFGSPLVLNNVLRQWINKANSLFEGGKCRSIIETTVLTLLKLYAEQGCDNSILVLDSTKSAQRILRTVSNAVLQDWIRSRKVAVRKLAHKVARPEFGSAARIASLEVLAMLDPDFELDEWPGLTDTLILKVITDNSPQVCDNAVLQTSLMTVIDALSSSARQQTRGGHATNRMPQTLQGLINLFFEVCRPASTPSIEHMNHLTNAETLLNALQQQCQTTESPLCELFVRMVNSTGLPDWWSLDLDLLGTDETCSVAAVCFHDYNFRQQSLRRDLCLFVMGVASTRNIDISTNTFGILRRCLSIEHTTLITPCQYPSPTEQAAGIADISQPQMSSHDWRGQLKVQLARTSNQAMESIETFICDVTKDLQDRCNTVEEPLRQARAEVHQLQEALNKKQCELQETHNAYENLQQALVSEKETLRQSNDHADALRESNSKLQQQLCDAHADLANTKDSIQTSLREHQQDLDALRAQLQREKDEIHRVHQMRVSDIEDSLLETRQSETALSDENTWLRDELNRVNSEANLKYDTEIGQLQQLLQNEQTAARAHATELESDLASKQSDNDRLVRELQLRNEEYSKIQRENESFREQVQDTKSKLEECKNTTTALEDTLAREQEKYKELAVAREREGAVIEQQRQRITELEASEASWHEQCKIHAKALKKARKAEESVMAIFQRNSSAVQSSRVSRGSTVTATATPTPRMPQGSFVSEDYEDYSELMNLGKDQ